MLPPWNRLLDTTPSLIQVLCILAATYGAIKYIEAKRSPLNAIPTVGHSGVLTSYITAIRWLLYGPELLREGYDSYPNRVFKIAAISKWVVVLSGKQHVDDIRRASDDILSLAEAIEEMVHTKYVLGPMDLHPHHEITLRSHVNRNITLKSHEVLDEVEVALQHYIPATEDWVTFPALATFQKVICRTINRYFVGTPICRDPGYCDLIENYVTEVVLSGKIISCVPELLRPLVGNYLTPVSKTVKQAMQYLGPTVTDRIARYQQYGKDDPDRPNDIISWFLETATEDYHRTLRDIVNRILLLNFAAIHTTSMVLTQTLYDIAIRPEFLNELREEAQGVVQEHGWSKSGMQKLRKLDSFMKESARLSGTGSLSLLRKTLKDWTTSDGTLIPAGSFIGVAVSAMAQAKNNFEDPDVFKPFRFSEMRDGDGKLDSIKHQMVSLEHDHIIFGHGRHACPGRFLAVHEIKIILAQILLKYDIQLENGSMNRPSNLSIESAVLPNPKAKMRFRKKRID